ncbi:OLC1v1022489C1 [Oldenlandia corymbosa var. corymbosa]|uniref:OLC1v1022489C1 n=1 Tax=Oldenlandia corymbosa var. corymbosa TaxID=529605 RepID=A0AAV1BXX9_OLDCO|nr:OLC1v1022489C1 [Oldenlandia corymbosa var. corymbosa]
MAVDSFLPPLPDEPPPLTPPPPEGSPPSSTQAEASESSESFLPPLPDGPPPLTPSPPEGSPLSSESDDGFHELHMPAGTLITRSKTGGVLGDKEEVFPPWWKSDIDLDFEMGLSEDKIRLQRETAIEAQMLDIGSLEAEGFLWEAKLLQQLRHPNIIQIYGVDPDGPARRVRFAMELMPHGSLQVVLKGGRDSTNPICKIGDLGISRFKDLASSIDQGPGDVIALTAPEIIRMDKENICEKVDVYAFAFIMWDIMSYCMPLYPEMTAAEIGAAVLKSCRPVVPSHCNQKWKQLMVRCWNQLPERRPHMHEVADVLDNLLTEVSQEEKAHGTVMKSI